MSIRIKLGYAALMSVLGVSVFVRPDWSAVNWAAIGLLSAGAIGYGAWRHAPVRRAPWWWLASAVLAMAIGDTVYGTSLGGDTGPLSIVSEICYFLTFPPTAAALILLSRTSIVLRDRSRLLDLLTFGCGVVCAAWAFLFSPGLNATTLGSVEKSVLAAYLSGGLVVLVAVTRLVFAAPRNRSVQLLALGAFGMLVGDVVYALTELRGAAWELGNPAELGYLALYASWGAAALSPSMVRLTAPVEARPSQLRGRWIVLLGLSLAIPPATLLLQSLSGQVRDGVMIAVLSLLMLAVVITRLVDAIADQRHAAARERGLREACSTLVAATGPAEIQTAVRVAVHRLMPRGVDHGVVLTVEDTSTPPPPVPATPGLVRRTRILPTATLPPSVLDELGEFPSTLVCPLVLDGASTVGELCVAADHRVLDSVRDAVEILAAQATLALERISLTDEANRRESDQYVRNVVQNTSDVVLIVDDDGRIRYASPSLAAILGMDLHSFATLREIVHQDDHRQVARILAPLPAATADGAAADTLESEGVHDRWSLRRCDGGRALVAVTCRDLRNDRMVRGFVITMRDITDSLRDEQELIRQALADSPAGQNRKSALNKFR